MSDTTGIVRRSDLIERIATSPAGSVVVVVAPAGFGKSTLIGQVRPVLGRTAHVLLDPTHDEPARFVAAVRAAVDAGGIDRGRRGDDRFDDVARLLRERSAAGELDALVLDDVHVLSNPAVERMIADLAAANVRSVRLVLSSRREPPIRLAHLKVTHRLIEIDERDLALELSAARTVVDHLVGQRAAVDDLTLERLGGWPAAVVLLGIALAEAGGDGPGGEAGLIQFRADLHAYVVEAVLAELPDDLNTLVLELAVIGSFDGGIAAASLGRPNTRQLIGEVRRRRLFLEQDPDRPGLWRFRDIFREAVAKQADALGRDRIRALRRRHVEALLADGWLDLAADRLMTLDDLRMIGEVLADNELLMMWGRRGSAPSREIRGRPIHQLAGDPLALRGAELVAVMSLDLPRMHEAREVRLAGAAWNDPALSPSLLPIEGLHADTLWDNDHALEAFDLAISRLQAPEWRSGAAHVLARFGRAVQLMLADRLGEAATEARVALAFADQTGVEAHRSSLHALIALDAIERGDEEVRRAASIAARHAAERSVSRLDVPLTTILHMAVAVHAGDLEEAYDIGHAVVIQPDFVLVVPSFGLLLLELAAIESRIGRRDEAAAHIARVDMMLERSSGLDRMHRIRRELTGALSIVGGAGARPRVELSDSESKVIRLLSTRMTLKEIGDELYLSVNTIKTHTQAIYRKLGVSSRAEAVEAIAVERRRDPSAFRGLVAGADPADRAAFR